MNLQKFRQHPLFIQEIKLTTVINNTCISCMLSLNEKTKSESVIILGLLA